MTKFDYQSFSLVDNAIGVLSMSYPGSHCQICAIFLVCVGVCRLGLVFMGVCADIRVYRGQRSSSHVFLNHSSP